MLAIPEEIKKLFKRNNVSQETQRSLCFSFYDETVDALYPYETLFPDTELYPASLGEPWLVIKDDQIVQESLELTESICEDENLRFGACESCKIEFTVADVADDIKGKMFNAELIVGGYRLAFGIYRVDDVVVQQDKRFKKIVAYDRMILFDEDVAVWYNNLAFPLTLREFRSSLLDYVGVPAEQAVLPNDAMMIQKTLDTKSLTGRAVLERICEINGVFGHFDRTGTFKYVLLGYGGIYPEETLYPYAGLYPSESSEPEEVPARYKSIDYKEWIVQSADRLELYDETGALAASEGSGDNRCVIRNNFLIYKKRGAELQQIAQNASTNIFGRTYKPATVEMHALPYVEVGDLLSVEYSKGTIESFVMKRHSKGVQAMMDTFEATGDEYRSDATSLQDRVESIESSVTNTNERLDDTRNDLDAYKGDTDAFKTETGKNFDIVNTAVINETKRAQTAEGALTSSITQTASQIQLEVQRATDEENSIRSQIKMTAEEINLSVTEKVNGLDGALRSEIKLTKDSIISTVENKEAGLKSEIRQTADSITSKVNDKTGNLQSQITQQAGQITSVVRDLSTANNRMSQISQTADKINFIVKSGSSSSNFTLTDGAVSIISKELNISGLVKFTDLSGSGRTTINGSNITTGTIDARQVTVKNINADYITSGTIDASRIKVTNISASSITSGKLDVSLISAGGSVVMRLYSSRVFIGEAQGGVSLGGTYLGFFGASGASRRNVVYPHNATAVLASLQQLITALRSYNLIG